MSFNPFEERPVPIDKTFVDWQCMYPKSYDKCKVDPYTKTRIILMNGTEFEAQWFSRNFSRHCPDNNLRRELALVRRVEQQQQKIISNLKPKNENQLEHTIGYEQLAVDLTAELAKEGEKSLRQGSAGFCSAGGFYHLYRYSDLLEMEYNILPEKLVGGYTEIMPGRPTISEHRYPYDTIRKYIKNKNSDMLTILNVNIITAAEQQTMNYYMNVGAFYTKSDLGRRLYQEIAMIEEQHVSQYESLKDTTVTWLEDLLMHEYTECYLYYSCMMTEPNPYIRKLWEQFMIQEISHLHKAKDLLWKYEGNNGNKLFRVERFLRILCLGSNIEYVRNVLKNTVHNTAKKECIVPVCDLPKDYEFFKFQNIVNHDVCQVPSHMVINEYICQNGIDYRYEVRENPIPELRNRCKDNTTVGRVCMDNKNCNCR